MNYCGCDAVATISSMWSCHVRSCACFHSGALRHSTAKLHSLFAVAFDMCLGVNLVAGNDQA